MNKNGRYDVYLTLKEESLEETKKEAREKSIELSGKEGKGEFSFPDSILDIDEMYLEEEDEVIMVSGMLNSFGKELGYLSININLTPELCQEIIEYKIKQLKKVKEFIDVTK